MWQQHVAILFQKNRIKNTGELDIALIHSKLCSITPVATKVHAILWTSVVLTWMRDTIELV